MALLGTYVPHLPDNPHDTNDLPFPGEGPAEWCPACAQSQHGVRSANRQVFLHCGVRYHENLARACAGLARREEEQGTVPEPAENWDQIRTPNQRKCP